MRPGIASSPLLAKSILYPDSLGFLLMSVCVLRVPTQGIMSSHVAGSSVFSCLWYMQTALVGLFLFACFEMDLAQAGLALAL